MTETAESWASKAKVELKRLNDVLAEGIHVPVYGAAAARPLYERTLSIRERVLVPDHPDTAGSLNNLAGPLYVQGDYAAARPLVERTLAILEARFGPDHPDTKIVREDLEGL